MTNEQLIELIQYCPDFSQDQKSLYESLLKKDSPPVESEHIKELILKLIEEKINLSILKQYLETSEELYTALETTAKVEKMKDIVKKAEKDYSGLKSTIEQEKIKQIKFRAGLE